MRSTKAATAIFLLFPVCLFAQGIRSYADTGWNKVQNNIFRIVATAPVFPGYETMALIHGQYERRLGKKYTAVAKLGFGNVWDNFGPDEDPHRSTYHFFTAVEGRYYFSLDRRVRKRRPIVNYTGPYVSIETMLLTNKIIAVNPTPARQFYGNVSSYLNIGYQKQVSNLYIGGYFGVIVWGKRFSDFNDYAAGFHGGCSVGYVF